VIERMRRRGGHVHVTLLLADGRAAATRLERLEADWLDLRVGDIVPVRPLARGPVSV
jgi:class 3 adenylate cyclase